MGSVQMCIFLIWPNMSERTVVEDEVDGTFDGSDTLTERVDDRQLLQGLGH